MNKVLAITTGIVMGFIPMVASAQSYESYRQAADGYRPVQQPAQSYDGYRQAQPSQGSPRWDSINTQVLPPVRSFNRASAATSSEDFSDNGYSSMPSAPEYQPAPQSRCGTGQVFVISPENTTTHNQVTMCQNEAGQWSIKR